METEARPSKWARLGKLVAISAGVVGISFVLCGLGSFNAKYLGCLEAAGIIAFAGGLLGLVCVFFTFIVLLFTKPDDGWPQ